VTGQRLIAAKAIALNDKRGLSGPRLRLLMWLQDPQFGISFNARHTGMRSWSGFRGAFLMRCGRAGLVVLALAGLLAQAPAASARCPDRPPCKGCGCKGGPGYRVNATGKCVGFKALKATCGDPPTLR